MKLESRRESKARFLNAALHVIRARDYSATRIENICEAAFEETNDDCATTFRDSSWIATTAWKLTPMKVEAAMRCGNVEDEVGKSGKALRRDLMKETISFANNQ
jgi:hypothetical protein